ILDRNNQAIAISTTVYNIALDLRNIAIEDDKKQQKIMQILSEELEIDLNTLMGYLAKDSDGTLKDENDTHWKIIKKKVPYEKGKNLEERLSKEKLKGVYLEEDSQREYPHKSTASHMIGFIMGDTSWGLESYYNSEMTGTPGRIFRTYEMNNSVVTRDIAPIKGNDIVTTLDLTIQQFAEDIVEKTYKEATPDHTPISTSMIVINPKTGEILAMAQYPNYDLNDPLNISLLENEEYKANFEKLSEEDQMKERNSVWKNFSVSDTFEPGSTFKAMLVAAALEEGVITMNDTFYCEGYRMIGGHKIRCHHRSGHGKVNVEQALAQSCNMAMIDIANKLGKEKFYKYQRDFGFGEKTGIDLYGEVDASNLLYSLDRINTVELATSSFGQGFNATSLQTIMAFASTINGGNLMKPYIVSQIIDENGKVVKENSPHIIRKVVSQETSDIVREAMVSTVSSIGTGKKAIIEGYSLAGKTGTAQQGNRADNIFTLSFAAYLPAEDPEYLALAVIHKPKNYSDGVISPVPMIKELFLNIINYKAIPPSNPEAISEEVLIENDDIILKDYSNKSLQETIKDLNNTGLSYQIVGSGGDTVVKHFPAGNTRISKNSEILLYVETIDKEKELQVVPDLLNLNTEEARAILEKMGFEVFIEEGTPITLENNKEENKDEESEEIIEGTVDENADTTNLKKVYEQMPQAGVYIEKGSSIKLKVS
ncbi:MAG: PASTA domain-containing protein, partial [Eubacteriales bacterium]|nr:PASTA domain-containing protein [Eubacteriales bacterium]